MKLCRNKDLFSPDYHLYVGKGWVNDPCGCSIYKGEYHIFFQYHEEPTPLGPGKWYHMKSKEFDGSGRNWEFACGQNFCMKKWMLDRKLL